MEEDRNAQPVSSQEGGIPESDMQQAMKPQTGAENRENASLASAERLSFEIERFSDLSSDMITLLKGLTQEIHKSAGELRAVRSAVDLKRKELEVLYETEKTATALERQIEDFRRQKENLEFMIADQRSGWEAEKVRQAREEKEYIESRKLLREQDEEEYRRVWAAEQSRARQMFEEELRTIRQKSQDAQEAAEKVLVSRELILKKKEQEWSQLIQELEQFLSRLAKRIRPHADAPAVLPGEAPADRSASAALSASASAYFNEEPNSPKVENESRPDPDSERVAMWETLWEEKDLLLGDKNPNHEKGLTEEQRSSLSLKELHILQGGKPDDSNSDSSSKRDCIPIKLSLTKPGNSNPED